MNKILVYVVVLGFVVGFQNFAIASYKGSGGSYGSSGSSGTYKSTTKNAAIIAVESHIKSKSSGGYYSLRDPKTGKTRKMKAIGLGTSEKKVSSTQSVVYGKFRDMKTNEVVEVDFKVRTGYGQPRVQGVTIYAVNGKKY